MALKIGSNLYIAVVLSAFYSLTGCSPHHNKSGLNHINSLTTSPKSYSQLVKNGKFRIAQKSPNNKPLRSLQKNDKAPSTEIGYASWYASSFHGKKTFSGVIYDELEHSAAHRTLPIPSVVKVTNLANKKEVLVVINDRGPFKGGSKRIIDISRKAAEELDIIKQGVAKVQVEYMVKETKDLLEHLPQNEKKKAFLTLSYLQ